MEKLTLRALIAVGALLLGGCFEGVPTKQPPPVGAVDEVHVTANGDGLHPIAIIDDPVRVKAIVSFVNARGSGWETSPFGVPVPAVNAQLYVEGKFLGKFGAGHNFFETNRGCGFCSRSASTEEVTEFLKLLDVDERYLDINYRPNPPQSTNGNERDERRN
jgi:hypothetical protein